MEADWKDYLKTTEYALDKLTHDETRSLAKIVALHLGQYRNEHGDLPDEKYMNFMNMENMSDEAKEVFIKGMEVLLSVVREMEYDRERGLEH